MAMANKMVCPKCGHEIGEKVEIPGSGKHLLKVGGMMARNVHGVCGKCLAPFHWDITDWELNKIAQKMDEK